MITRRALQSRYRVEFHSNAFPALCATAHITRGIVSSESHDENGLTVYFVFAPLLSSCVSSSHGILQ